MKKSSLNWIIDWPIRMAAAKYDSRVLSRLCGVHPRTLRRYLFCQTHLSAQKLLDQLRLEKAPQLLGAGMSVKEASDALGYKQQSHFSRAFKRFYGIPPSDFNSARHESVRHRYELSARDTPQRFPIAQSHAEVLINRKPNEVHENKTCPRIDLRFAAAEARCRPHVATAAARPAIH